MKIAIAGASGFVGSALIPHLERAGHTLIKLVRDKSGRQRNAVFWNPSQGEIDRSSLEGIEGVINLAGESIMGWWTEAKKERIKNSRIAATALLAKTLCKLKKTPQVLINASAVGYYGDRGAEILDEKSSSGSDFLSEVCRQWESATDVAENKGIRVVKLRIGTVLSPEGGALKKMIPPFKLCLGGHLGSGKQYMSWISREDLQGVILHVLANLQVRGAVNAVAPQVITNAELTQALSLALHRPAVLHIPAFMVKFLLGEMSEVLLGSQIVQPCALKESGYAYLHPDLSQAFQAWFP